MKLFNPCGTVQLKLETHRGEKTIMKKQSCINFRAVCYHKKRKRKVLNCQNFLSRF